MAHPNEELLRREFEALGAGDMDGVQALMADDIVWHFPGNSPISGTFTGKDAVMGWLAKNMELSGGTLRVEPHDILGNDEHGVALARVSGQREGKTPLNDPSVQVCHIKDGKITETWVNPQDQAASDEFWS